MLVIVNLCDGDVQETTNKAFKQFKGARKTEEGRVAEMQAAVKQVQDVVASFAHDDGTDAGDEAVGDDVEMQDSQAVDATQDVVNE